MNPGPSSHHRCICVAFSLALALDLLQMWLVLSTLQSDLDTQCFINCWIYCRAP